MAVVGFSFSKISGVKSSTFSGGEVRIAHNVTITNVSKSTMDLGASKQELLKFNFDFKVQYEPKVAELSFEGEILFMDALEVIIKVEKEWKKSKHVQPQELLNNILFNILSKCNIEALLLSRELNLPPPFPIVPNLQPPADSKKTVETE